MRWHAIYRDAESGQFVTKRYALANPRTTVAERVGPVRALLARLAVKP